MSGSLFSLLRSRRLGSSCHRQFSLDRNFKLKIESQIETTQHRNYNYSLFFDSTKVKKSSSKAKKAEREDRVVVCD